MRPIAQAMEDIGRLTSLDEGLNHQIVDTFSAVQTSEHSWTEKVWSAVIKTDGTLGLDFGLGRYHNRGVMDGFAGVARGKRQWTVRASRELRDDPSIMNVGPIAYEIIEPLHKVRFTLARNEIQPIAFDITFTSHMPCFFEDRHRQREKDGFRIGSDVVRYTQCGEPRGWIEIEGERVEVEPEGWREFRDHSWGVRLDVGLHQRDIRPTADYGDAKFGEGEFYLFWSPFMLTGRNGERVGYHVYYQSRAGKVFYSSGYRNLPDGTQEKIARIRPELKFDDLTRRLAGGRLHFDMLQGGTRTVEIEVLGKTGFQLGPALYCGFGERRHGSWHGPFLIEGEAIADTSDLKTIHDIRQLRDCPIRVTEGDLQGFGVFESIVHGGNPEMGLTAANSFI